MSLRIAALAFGLFILALLSGCARAPFAPSRGKPAYANLKRLLAGQPDWERIEKLDETLKRLRSRPGGLGPDPSVLIPRLPPVAPFPEMAGTEHEKAHAEEQIARLTTGQLEVLRRELARTRAEKLEAEERTLRRAADKEIAAEKERRYQHLWEQRQQVLQRFAHDLLSQRTQLEILPKADPRRKTEEAKLAELESQQKKQLAALDAQTEQAIAQFVQDKRSETERRLAAFRAELLSQESQRLAEAKTRSERRAASAKEALVSAFQAQTPPNMRIEPGPIVARMTESSQKLAAQRDAQMRAQKAQFEKLERARNQLELSLRQKIAEEAVALAARHGYLVSFETKEAKRRPDITPQLLRWLRDWTYQVSPASEAAPL